MNIHICKENPCPEMDKECLAILKAGASINYTAPPDAPEKKCNCSPGGVESDIWHYRDCPFSVSYISHLKGCLLYPPAPRTGEKERKHEYFL